MIARELKRVLVSDEPHHLRVDQHPHMDACEAQP